MQKKIVECMFREYTEICMTVSKILCTLAGGPRLLSAKPILKFGTSGKQNIRPCAYKIPTSPSLPIIYII